MSTGLNIYDIRHLSVSDILQLDGSARNRKNRKGSKEIHQPRTPSDPKLISSDTRRLGQENGFCRPMGPHKLASTSVANDQP